VTEIIEWNGQPVTYATFSLAYYRKIGIGVMDIRHPFLGPGTVELDERELWEELVCAQNLGRMESNRTGHPTALCPHARDFMDVVLGQVLGLGGNKCPGWESANPWAGLLKDGEYYRRCKHCGKDRDDKQAHP